MISVDSPRRKMRLSPAIDSIAAGAAVAGSVLGLKARGEKPRTDSEVEPTPSLPDLQLLRFVDESECSTSQQHGYSWESVQPPSFVEWAYRDTPRRKGRPPVSGEVSTTSILGPSTDLRTISESTRSSGKCKRAATATPSTTAGSTRVPSRASPEEFAPHGLPRPPSRQRTKGGRPRSSMGVSDARSNPRTSPKRPQTSMGISQSSSSTSPPPDSAQSRPRSCLNFSRGGSPDVISVPPRPQSSTDVYVDVYHSTDSSNLDVRCGSRSEEVSMEHARTPTPNTGSCGIESSGVTAALSRSEQLNAAAEEAGAKARGEITLAMRARTICRLAGNAASRKLLHLWGEWDCPPESLLAGEERTGSKDKTGRPGSVDTIDIECNKLKAPGGPAGHFNASPLFGGEFPKKRCIKVAANTALGRMVSADPERAAKYDLVTIPSWQLNKPWPPPAIGTRQLIKQADNQRRAKAFEMEEEKIARMERAENRRVLMKKRVAKMQAVTTLMGLGLRLRQSRERVSTRTEESEAYDDGVRSSANSTDGFEMADLESAGNILDWAQKEAFKGIFNRYSKYDDYKLTRRGMIKAMREAGLTPTTQEEQRRFAAVQVQVLEATRGEFEEQPEDNPLTSPQGRWEMSEFLLVCAALREINLRKLRVANEEAAEEFDVPLAEVEELRSVFHRYDKESTGTITSQDMKELLLVVDMKTSDDDFLLLLQSAGLHKERFDFKEFLKLTTSLDSAMKSPVKMVAPTPEKKPPVSPIKSTKTLGNLQSQEAATTRAATPRADRSDKKLSTLSLGISSPLKSMRTLGNLQSSPGGALTPRNRSITRPL